MRVNVTHLCGHEITRNVDMRFARSRSVERDASRVDCPDCAKRNVEAAIASFSAEQMRVLLRAAAVNLHIRAQILAAAKSGIARR